MANVCVLRNRNFSDAFLEEKLSEKIRRYIEDEFDYTEAEYQGEEFVVGHLECFTKLAPYYIKSRVHQITLEDAESILKIFNDYHYYEEDDHLSLDIFEVEDSEANFVEEMIGKIGFDEFKKIIKLKFAKIY